MRNELQEPSERSYGVYISARAHPHPLGERSTEFKAVNRFSEAAGIQMFKELIYLKITHLYVLYVTQIK